MALMAPVTVREPSPRIVMSVQETSVPSSVGAVTLPVTVLEPWSTTVRGSWLNSLA